MVAPILNEKGNVEYYLPKGTWVNINDKITYEGGRTVCAKAEIDQFIAFIKSGSEVLDIFTEMQ